MNKIEEFLDGYKNKNTIYGHKVHLNKFFKIIRQNPDTYFKKDRDYKQDVIKFWKVLMKRDTPPLSIKNAMSSVRVFLEENEVTIPKRTWKNLRNKMKGTRPLTIDLIPKPNELKRILQHATAKERAIFLISSSSGMRIDEVLQLIPDDIDMDNNPVKINIRGTTTKSGNPRLTFISNEAKESIEEWLKVRDDYLLTSYRRSRNKISKEGKKLFVVERRNERLFPFTYAPTRKAWINLIIKSGFDKKDRTTKRYRMHIHALRKYFRTRMALEIPVDVVEALMGHEGYLTQAYRQYSEDQLGELYNKAVHNINVFDIQPDLSGIHEQMKEKDQTIKEMQKRMENMDEDIRRLSIKLLTQDDKKK